MRGGALAWHIRVGCGRDVMPQCGTADCHLSGEVCTWSHANCAAPACPHACNSFFLSRTPKPQPPHGQVRFHVDDPLESSAIHFGCGGVGTLMLALLARPTYVQELTGYDCGGLVYGGRKGAILLGLQLLGEWLVAQSGRRWQSGAWTWAWT